MCNLSTTKGRLVVIGEREERSLPPWPAPPSKGANQAVDRLGQALSEGCNGQLEYIPGAEALAGKGFQKGVLESGHFELDTVDAAVPRSVLR